MKIIVLLLVLGTVLLSGCAGNEQPSPEGNVTPEETVTPGENVTVVEQETPVENATSEENESEGAPEASTSGMGKTSYTVRLENYRASPPSLEIKEGEAVAWINMHDNPKRVFTLVSEENLFENTNLVYRRAFAYTFNQTGDYKFTVIGQPKMNVSVSVT